VPSAARMYGDARTSEIRSSTWADVGAGELVLETLRLPTAAGCDVPVGAAPAGSGEGERNPAAARAREGLGSPEASKFGFGITNGSVFWTRASDGDASAIGEA
jgi:hypothetical protein